MKKLDLLLGGVLVAVAGVFYYLISQLPESSKVYPTFVTTVLLGLTLLHIILTIRKKEDPNEKTGFEDFLPKQFYTVLGLSGLYVLCINIIGYIVSTFAYLVITLIALKTDKKVSLVISIGVAAAIYVLFKILLKVPLPTGFLI